MTIALLFVLACTPSPDPARPSDLPPQTGRPGAAGQAVGPARPGGAGRAQGGGSGAAMQDPSGFPDFHDRTAPAGPPLPAGAGWSTPVRLTADPGGGYRPQIAVAPDGRLHAVYYERTQQGDLIRHRTSRDGATWTDPVPLGFDRDRNWGPDIVARADGSVVVCFDHAKPDFTSRAWLTTWTEAGGWSAPAPLTADDPRGEVGSGHVADGTGDDLAFVWIGKRMDPRERFRALWRWRSKGVWSESEAFTDGANDAWHTNVERRPDGSVLAAWDVGVGGSETTLYVAEGRDGSFRAAEDLSRAPGKPGERAHFAFGADGTDHATWFHKKQGSPVAVYVRSGRPGAWSDRVDEPSAGVGGYHFDPDIAIDRAGTRVLVWGWDATREAELAYSVDRGRGWESARRVASLGAGKPGLPSLVVDAAGTFHAVWNQGVRGRSDVWYASWKP